MSEEAPLVKGYSCCQRMSPLSENISDVRGCPCCQKMSLLSKDVPFVRGYPCCQGIFLLSGACSIHIIIIRFNSIGGSTTLSKEM